MENKFFGETVNGAVCERLRDELANGQEFLKKFKVHPYVHLEMLDGLSELWKQGKTTAIIDDCANVYRKCGFDVTEQGIGWVIS